ncbi:MAG: DUF58 domain-containing protein [Anaerolineales bacterium]|nr:DUF58 domain-containing protein [Anaerolineales bacterium]
MNPKRPRQIVFFLILISFFAWGVSGRGIYLHLFYLWTGLFLVSWLWSTLMFKGIQLERTSSTLRSQVGDTIKEWFEVFNKSRIPILWLEIRDESSVLSRVSSRVHMMVKGMSKRSHITHIRLRKRGNFSLGPTTLVSGDPFGLFPVSVSFPNPDFLLVYPYTIPIYKFPNPLGFLPGGDALHRRTHQITPNAASIRDYMHGDSMNRIHWASTARRDRLIVKEFELDPSAEVWCFVDSNLIVHHALPETQETMPRRSFLERKEPEFKIFPSTEEYAATIAASLADYYLKRGRNFALVTGGEPPSVVTLDTGARQFQKILEALSLWEADHSIPFELILGDLGRNIPRGSTILLITPSGSERLPVAVAQLVRTGLFPIVLLLDSESFGGDNHVQNSLDTLKHLDVPSFVIREGDDLEQVLNGHSF